MDLRCWGAIRHVSCDTDPERCCTTTEGRRTRPSQTQGEIDMANVTEFTVANFEAEVTNSDVPVLVDFWAPWCGPCKQLGPTIEQLAGEYAGKAKVGKVNVDDHGDLAAQFGIRGIPTVLLFKGGKQVGSFVGLKPKDELAKALDAAL
jgi:thioredoxin 1